MAYSLRDFFQLEVPGRTEKKADRMASDRNRKRILIVDDEPMLLQGLGKALQNDAAEVVAMETGEAALKEVASSEFHLCFLDVFLPDMDGTEVLKRITALSPKTKVIMMSAGVINNSMKETIEKTAYMFIAKPFDLLQVRMLARRVIEETK